MKELKEEVACAICSPGPLARDFERAVRIARQEFPLNSTVRSTMKYDIQAPFFPDKTGSDLMRSDAFPIAGHSVKSSRFVSRSKSFSRAAAVLVMLIGAVALIGWLSDVDWLKSIYGDITMKANTALALMFAGASLWSLQRANH